MIPIPPILSRALHVPYGLVSYPSRHFLTYLSWGSDLGFTYIYMTRFIFYPQTQKHDMSTLIRSHWARLVHDLLAAMNMVMVDLVVPLFSLSIL